MRKYNMNLKKTSLNNENNNYWSLLIHKFLNNADSIRIDCYNYEEKIVEQLKQYSKIYETKNSLTSFYIDINDKVINEIIDKPYYDNKLKWNYFYLLKHNKCIINSEKYGEEFNVNEITSEEVESIKKMVTNNFIFSYWPLMKKKNNLDKATNKGLGNKIKSIFANA